MGIYRGPKIVRDGLVLYLDAGNPKSYPTSGTIWRDLSGNGKNGTLIGGPTFDSGNGGSIVFDGVNDIVSLGTGNTFFPLPQFTIDMWFKSLGTVPTTGINPGLFGFTFGVRSFLQSNSLVFGVDNGTNIDGVSVSGTFITDSKWYNVTFYHSGTTMGIYINGIFGNSVNRSWDGSGRYAGNVFNLGRDNNNPSQFFYGYIPICRIYSRVLTDEEIQQNYNGTKGRFGL